ncbi:MAG: cobalamin B12-binding domain-containing protein, partial [Clostridiaceae bacterium]|nr:cobalamin B12-binding domain-containing protein [Clostridiaceae bacterium]
MRIALINPPASNRYVHSIDEPLGLEYLAAQIKAEHEVLIIDSFSQKLSVKETIELVLEFSVDVVGISTVFSSTYKTSKDIFEGIKSVNPEIITVSGGNTATF